MGSTHEAQVLTIKAYCSPGFFMVPPLTTDFVVGISSLYQREEYFVKGNVVRNSSAKAYDCSRSRIRQRKKMGRSDTAIERRRTTGGVGAGFERFTVCD